MHARNANVYIWVYVCLRAKFRTLLKFHFSRVPTGATAGTPFKIQPQVAFVDNFLNPIEALDGNPMRVALMGGNGEVLSGTSDILSKKGIVFFTDLLVTKVGTYWLEFSASGYVLSSTTFTVVHGRAATVEFLSQPGNMSQGTPLVPQPLGQLRDAWANMVLLPYSFKARIYKTRVDGSSVSHHTHVSCEQCGGFYASHEFFSQDGYITFTDLAVKLYPDGPPNEIGLRLELIAVNLTLCERIGETLLCGPTTEYIHDGQVMGLTEPFNIFSITTLKITTEPADTNSSMTILGHKDGNDIYPRVELYATTYSLTGNSLFHAPVASFELEVTLYYAGSQVGSHCLQANSSESCLGICESNNTLCNRKCPKDLGSTGRQFTTFTGDASKYQDDVSQFDPLYKGIQVNKVACAYQTTCYGVLGNATCPNLRINRAGTYYLLFRLPACGLIPDLPWVRKEQSTCAAGKLLESKSRDFTIRPLTTTPGYLVTTCPNCPQPTVAIVNGRFLQQPVVQLVDPSGNRVSNRDFSVNVTVPSRSDCSLVGEDASACLPESGLSFGKSFEYRPMSDCNCLKGNLSVPVIDGYATFTDLSISTALRRVKLLFYSSNGLHNFSSIAFAVQPQLSISMQLRQQPIIAQAGHGITFELGLLDEFDFLSELDFQTQIHVSLVSSVPGGAAISCEARSACTVATSSAGYVRFILYINQTGTDFSLSFRGVFCGSGVCGEKIVKSKAFTVLSSAPHQLLITAQPSDTQSQVPSVPTPAVLLVDAFRNDLSENVPESQSALITAFKVGCDSIRLQLWCEAYMCAQVCAFCPGGFATPISFVEGDGSHVSCCAVTETRPANNEYACVHELIDSSNETYRTNTTNETYRTNVFRAELLNASTLLPPGNISRIARLNSSFSSSFIYGESIMVNSIPSLMGNVRVPSIHSAMHEHMTIDAVGDYTVRFSANNFSIISEALHTSWSASSNLHILKDVSPRGYLTTLPVSRRFGLTAFVSDHYGNIVLSHHPSINISLVEDEPPLEFPESLIDRVKGPATQILPSYGQVTFDSLFIEQTGARCEMTRCTLPQVRLQVSTVGTNSSGDVKIVIVYSSRFQVQHATVTQIVFALPPPSAFVAETRAPAIYVHAQDRFGNIAVQENTHVCAKIYGDDGVERDVTDDPVGYHSIEDTSSLIANGVKKNMTTGVSVFSLILRTTGSEIKVIFLYGCSNTIELELSPLEVVPINHIQLITQQDMPDSIAGDLVLQPVLTLCRSRSPACPQDCCLLSASADVDVTSAYVSGICHVNGGTVCGIDGAVVSSSILGVAKFTDLRIVTAGILNLRFKVGPSVTNTSHFTVKHANMSSIQVIRQPNMNIVAGTTFNRIEVHLTDDYVNIVSTPHYTSVKIEKANTYDPSISSLLLTQSNTLLAAAGILNFTDFKIRRSGSNYQLVFTSMYNSNEARTTSKTFNIVHGEVARINITGQPDSWEDTSQAVAVAGVFFRVSAVLLDKFENIAMHQCHALLNSPCHIFTNASISFGGTGTLFGTVEGPIVAGTLDFMLNITQAKVRVVLTICVANLEVPCYLNATTKEFEVVHNNESKVVVTAPASAAIYELLSGERVSSIQAGVSARVDVELQDSFGNQIRDRTRSIASIDWMGNPVVTSSNPTAELSVVLTGNPSCASDAVVSWMSCPNGASGCLTAAPAAFVRVEDVSMTSPCEQSRGPVSLSDGRARVAFRVDKAGRGYRVEVCPLHLVNPCRPNVLCHSEASCSTNCSDSSTNCPSVQIASSDGSFSSSCANGLAFLSCHVQTAATKVSCSVFGCIGMY